MEILIEKINVLEDGKVKISLSNNSIDWLQPIIIVDSYPTNENFSLKGSEGREGRVSVDSIEEIDGAAFSGTYEQLETALREAAKTANGLRVGGASGGGGGNVVVTNNTDPSTSTKQDDINDSLQGNLSGYQVLLSDIDSGVTPTFPLTISQLRATKGSGIPSEFEIDAYDGDHTLNSLFELVELWNNNMSFYKMVYNDGVEDRFYLRKGTQPLPPNSGVATFDFISFNDSLPPPVVTRIYRANVFTDAQIPLTGLDVVSIKQDTTNDAIIKKDIGFELEFTNSSAGASIIFPLIGLTGIGITINGVLQSHAFTALDIPNREAMTQLLNDLQTDIHFQCAEASDKLIFNSVFSPTYLVDSILFTYTGGSSLFDTFAESSDTPTGALHQAVVLLQKQQQLLKQLLTVNPEKAETISLSYNGNTVYNITSDTDLDGNVLPAGSTGDMTVIAIDNDVEYRFDGGTVFGSKKYPRTKKDNSTSFVNINFDTFRIKGVASSSDYAIVITLNK
jgi:hypothetical protein